MAETCEEEIKSGSPPPLNRAPSRQSSSAGRNNFGLGLYSLVFFLIVPRDFQNQNETNDSANKELLILVQLKKTPCTFETVRQRSRISCLLQFLHNSEVGLSIKE